MSNVVLHGDCLDLMPMLGENSVDSIVTDPPYGLSFMGKDWDHGVPGVHFWQEAYKALKPGGYLLAFGGSRTFHRLACAIEDAGFELRDTIMWVYGSGFPKSLDVSKAIDKMAGAEREVVGVAGKSGSTRSCMAGDFAGGEYMTTAPATDAARQWGGWGTALKPAFEPIILARKPLEGTVAANVLKHGVGGLNIDGCRVSLGGEKPFSYPNGPGGCKSGEFHYQGRATTPAEGNPIGRWPANLIHDGSDEVLALFPDSKGQLADVSATAPSAKTSNVYGAMKREGEPSADSDNEGAVGFKMKPGARRLDSGSAARFFYCAKASKADRGANHHPTVKPTDLMRYLCRLVTPPGGVILDPFTGSGSTGKAAVLEGFGFIGCELQAEYVAIATARIEAAAK